MLVVITIILILSVVATPAITSVLKGSQLSQGALIVGAEFALAKQTAFTKNCTVEVRVYQWGLSSVSGETATNPSTGKYRAMQMFRVNPPVGSGPTTFAALEKVQLLPAAIFIDSGNTLSNIITPPGSSTVPVKTTGTMLNLPLPQAGLLYNAVVFHFYPSGATDLSPSYQWFLTMHNINDGDNLTTPPKNFYTIQINPSHGSLRNFRPE